MGGMTIMAFAESHPEVFKERVAGVALVSTTAGGLHPHKIFSRLIPNRVGAYAAPRLIAGLARAPELVDSARRGSNIGYMATDMFAFGGDVPPEVVEFVDEMLAGTSMSVLAEFFPSFSTLDKFAMLRRLDEVPALILCGTADKLTSIGHSRKMAKELPSARLVESPGTGHMVIIEDRDLVNRELDRLIGDATK
jgi:pimeloyl-ACP methyl ester carboxylesterase